MSEHDKKKKAEIDPIQDMLERLRRVVDTPVEKLEFSSSEKPVKPKKPSTRSSTKKAAEPKEDSEPVLTAPAEEPAAEPVAEETVIEEPEIPFSVEETDGPEEEVEADESADEIDDQTIAAFFAPAEEDEEEGEEQPSVSDEPPFTPDVAEPIAEATEVQMEIEIEDEREYDLLTLEDASVLDEDVQDSRDNSWMDLAFSLKEEERKVVAPITPDSFAFVREEPLFAEEEDAPASEEVAPAREDADWLFRPRAFASPLVTEDESEKAFAAAEAQPEEIEANEDNGYSVEVEVLSPDKAWYATKEEETDTSAETSSLQTAEETTTSPREPEEPEQTGEPSFFVYPEEDEIDTVHVDDVDDLHVPQIVQNEVADTEESLAQDEIRAFQNAPALEKKTDKQEKRSIFAALASKLGKTDTHKDEQKNSVFSNKRDREEDDTPDALSGIYNEAGAEYHEYTSRNQIGLFSKRFTAMVSSCTVRVIALAFLCTLLFLLEDLPYLGVTLGGFFAAPGGTVTVHLVLVVLVILCCIPMLSYAWRHLFNNRVLPEAYLAIGLICSLLYDIILLLASVTRPYLFGLVPAVGALILSIVELVKTKGDFASFRMLSSSGDKLACSISCGAQTKSEAIAVSDMEEGTDTRILSVKKVGFAAGFFHRVSRVCEDGRKNLWLLIVALISSLAVAIVTGILIATHILPQNGLAAVYAFCVTLSFSFPICSLLLHKLPAVQLFSRAAATRCAVVGEVSALEYCDAGAVAFEDVEAFPARNVRVQRIKLYGDAALDRVLYRVAGLFSAVGGPLDGVFRSSTAEVGLSAEVRLLRAEEGGIVASVDGHEVCVGRGEYMLARNIHMYYDPDDEKNLLGGKINIMYAAEDGHLIAKFYVRYKMDEDFERDVEELHKRGIRTVIRTYDPNITEGLVAGISYTERFDVRVVRKTADQQNDFAVDRLNSGIVCKSSCRDILRTLFACRRMCQVIRVSENCNLLVACFGMLLSLLLCAFGVIFSIPSFLLAFYQLLWVGLIALGGKLYI